MADSENSRTLPKISRRKNSALGRKPKKIPYVINRRNLIPVAARVLQERIPDIPPRTASGPARVCEIWPDWWDLYQNRLHASRHRKMLEHKLLTEVGSRPAVEIEITGHVEPTVVTSFEEIRSLAFRIGPEQTARLRILLRQRRREWKKADERIGYSAALTEEQDVKKLEGIAGRVLLVMPTFYLVEVAAKLHCLLVMQDPDLKREDEPWRQLRTMLKELIHPRTTPF
ncbi:hypothetical protein RMR21_022015 [Agrobacterium sp. rho-8.1]|nr:hypothetical protein [Agrobacterium sp. rho-8.1]